LLDKVIWPHNGVNWRHKSMLSSRGVQYVYCMMHKCIMVKTEGSKETRKLGTCIERNRGNCKKSRGNKKIRNRGKCINLLN